MRCHAAAGAGSIGNVRQLLPCVPLRLYSPFLALSCLRAHLLRCSLPVSILPGRVGLHVLVPRPAGLRKP